MKKFQGKVAVVTGAASGIGLAIAERCVHKGMQVVLVDVEKPALDKVADVFTGQGGTVLAVPTDVSDSAAMEALAQRTLDAFGGVHLLFNNAGVTGGNVATGTLADWEWTLGVNLFGVVHGVRVFTPIMLAQDSEAYIVNTASVAGLISGGLGIYTVSKHAVVALSEALYHELAQMNANVNVSVLCPGWVRTKILESNRNRPAALQNTDAAPPTPEDEAGQQETVARLEAGMDPTQVADCVFEAIENETFYILPNTQEWEEAIRLRTEDILQQRNPTHLW